MSETTAAARFDLGRVLQLAAGALKRNLPTFGLLALLCVGAPTLALGLLAMATPSPVTSANILLTIGQCILQGTDVNSSRPVHGHLGEQRRVLGGSGMVAAGGQDR